MGSLRYRMVAAGGLALIRVFEALVRRVTGDVAFYDPAKLPWTVEVERKWLDAREELRALLADENAVPAFEQISGEQARLVRPRTWKVFMFYTFGCKVPANCSRCPKTTALLESIPGMTLGMFSVLTPARASLLTEASTTAFCAIILLVVPSKPEQCAIRVGGETRRWEEGKSLIFDDTHEHEAWNDTEEDRVVLFVDFLRDLPKPLSWLNRGMLRLIASSPYVQNMLTNIARLEQRELRDERV